MKRIVFVFSILVSCASYANNIKLIPTKFSNTKECKNFGSFKTKDNYDEFKDFNLLNGDYLTVSIFSKHLKKCYSIKYYPEMTPFVYFTFTRDSLKVTEMAGTASSGNWFYKLYKLDKANQNLIYKSTSPVD